MFEIGQVLQFLVIFGIAVPLFIFGVYGAIIVYYNKRKREKSLKNGEKSGKGNFEPTVTIVIPTHNETSIISKRIENLLALDYPIEKLEILFVDDSNDSTPSIIENYLKRYPNIHLMRFEKRMGYSPSLIAGCKAANGEIVVLAEASSFLEPETIHHLVSNFQDPRIGVVTGKDMILNLNEEMGQSENTYQRIYDFVREAESNMDSTIYMKGEAAAVRKSLVSDLEELDGCPGTADTAIGLYARSKGYRFIFDPQVKFYEYAPSTNSGRVKQKVIRGANLIKVLWYFRSMFFKPKYGKFGMITLPFSFAMLAIVPVSILVGFVSLILLTFFEPTFSFILWAIIGVVLIAGLVYSKRLIITVMQFEYSLLKALYEIVFVRKSHDKIEKVDSTRRNEQ